jgi:hypothetical protein
MNNTTANNDNNSSNDEANSQLDAETNSNIAFISEAYQASIKSVPSQNIDANILKMAQQQRKHQKSTISKPAKLRWWENQHFYGAIAASVLVVCVIYILPTNAPNMQTDDATIAHFAEETELRAPVAATSQLTSELGAQQRRERQNLKEQLVEQERAYTSQKSIASNEPTRLALHDSNALVHSARVSSVPTMSTLKQVPTDTSENALASVTADMGTSMTDLVAEKIQVETVTAEDTKAAPSLSQSPFLKAARMSSEATIKEIAPDVLMAQNTRIIAELLKLQEQTNMQHQQIITAANNIKQEQEIANNSDLPAVIYAQQHKLMKRNLRKLLESNTKVDLMNVYKDVLSAEELEVFNKISAESSAPE